MSIMHKTWLYPVANSGRDTMLLLPAPYGYMRNASHQTAGCETEALQCGTYRGLWGLVVVQLSYIAQWQSTGCTSQVSLAWFSVTTGLFTFLHFRLKKHLSLDCMPVLHQIAPISVKRCGQYISLALNPGFPNNFVSHFSPNPEKNLGMESLGLRLASNSTQTLGNDPVSHPVHQYSTWPSPQCSINWLSTAWYP